jgi:hypothetical protein
MKDFKIRHRSGYKRTTSHGSSSLLFAKCNPLSPTQQHQATQTSSQSFPPNQPTTTIIKMLFTNTLALAIMAISGANAAASPQRPRPVVSRPQAPQFNVQTINCGSGAARESHHPSIK